MKKFLLVLFGLTILTTQCFAAYEWRKGTGENVILGTENGSDIDSVSYQNIVSPIDRLLSNYRRGASLTYASASTITVGIGEVVCSNSDGSVRKFRANTTATTVGWGDIDTGAEAGSTTYYIYAVSDSDANTFTCSISTNSSAPSSKTYYKKLGSFYNDGSSNITNITNDDSVKLSDKVYDSGWFAVSTGTAYIKTHNLGTSKIITNLYYSASSDGSNAIDVTFYSDNLVGNYGGSITAITPTQLTINTGNYDVVLYSTASSYAVASSGYYRIVAYALE